MLTTQLHTPQITKSILHFRTLRPGFEQGLKDTLGSTVEGMEEYLRRRAGGPIRSMMRGGRILPGVFVPAEFPSARLNIWLV